MRFLPNRPALVLHLDLILGQLKAPDFSTPSKREELARKLPALLEKLQRDDAQMLMFVLMRMVTSERVQVTHRRHLDAAGRDVRRETPQNQAAASSIFLPNIYWPFSDQPKTG